MILILFFIFIFTVIVVPVVIYSVTHQNGKSSYSDGDLICINDIYGSDNSAKHTRNIKTREPFSDPPEQDPEFAEILQQQFDGEDAMWDTAESYGYDE